MNKDKTAITVENLNDILATSYDETQSSQYEQYLDTLQNLNGSEREDLDNFLAESYTYDGYSAIEIVVDFLENEGDELTKEQRQDLEGWLQEFDENPDVFYYINPHINKDGTIEVDPLKNEWDANIIDPLKDWIRDYLQYD